MASSHDGRAGAEDSASDVENGDKSIRSKQKGKLFSIHSLNILYTYSVYLLYRVLHVNLW